MENKILKELSLIIRDRKENHSKDSYVSSLFEKGKVKIANKVGEEAFETVSAFLSEGKKEITEESADLLFHLLILLEESNVSLDDVLDVLKKRKENG
jgi:phosphoribosyl-ATP pyrophosphohydrolase/phosphoribosyl-AMP cyclohydrolase